MSVFSSVSYRLFDASQMFEVAGCPVRAAVLPVGAADGLVHGATAEALGGQLAAGLAVIARVLIVHY